MINPSLVIDKYLQIICDKVTESINLVESIILYGSYGRDEGSWYQDNEGNYQPYNDYDILLILDKKLPDNELESLKKKLLEKIDIRWIDISQMTKIELTKLKPSIFNYDLKYGSKVIYGDDSVLDLIPSINSSELPLVEGEVLFITRLWTLLGCLDDKGFNIDRSDEDVRFFRNQMAKAVLAVIDVLLLQKKAYHTSYKQRIQNFIDFYPEKEELCEISRWALKEKLFPKDKKMTAQEIEQLYSKVHRHYFEEMYLLLSEYYDTPINNPEQIEAIWKWNPEKLIYRIGATVFRWNLKKTRQLLVNIAQIYIVCAYIEKKIDKDYLTKGISLIQKLNKNISSELTWDEARVEVAKLRIEV
jgi:hypothetical protein